MATGGSVESIDFAGRPFSIAADADVTLDVGGYTNEIQPNGDRTFRVVKSVKAGGIENAVLAIDLELGDPIFLQELADLKSAKPITVTCTGGAVYQGTAVITGDIKTSLMNATCTVSFGIGGKMTLQ